MAEGALDVVMALAISQAGERKRRQDGGDLSHFHIVERCHCRVISLKRISHGC
jgi:hypothetical protein